MCVVCAVHLDDCEIGTSLTNTTLIRCPQALTVSVSMEYGMQWNGKQRWDIAVEGSGCDVRGFL